MARERAIKPTDPGQRHKFDPINDPAHPIESEIRAEGRAGNIGARPDEDRIRAAVASAPAAPDAAPVVAEDVAPVEEPLAAGEEVMEDPAPEAVEEEAAPEEEAPAAEPKKKAGGKKKADG